MFRGFGSANQSDTSEQYQKMISSPGSISLAKAVAGAPATCHGSGAGVRRHNQVLKPTPGSIAALRGIHGAGAA